MALECWAIANEVVTPEMSRLVAYLASSGTSGVVGSGDFLVRAQNVPNGTVKIIPGAGVAKSRFAGANYQSYAVRDTTPFDLPITATTSQGGRTDYVIIKVNDKQYSGDVNGVEYTTVQTLNGINYPYILCGKITLPPSTGTIQQSMIDSGPSVRELANPRQKSVPLNYNGSAPGNPLTSTTGERWANSWAPTVEIPAWATQVGIDVRIDGILASGKNMAGEVWARIYKDASNAVTGAHGVWTVDGVADFANVSRFSVGNVSRIYIPPAMRGGTHLVEVIGKRLDSNAASKPFIINGTSISVTFTFLESPVDDYV